MSAYFTTTLLNSPTSVVARFLSLYAEMHYICFKTT